MPTRILFGPKEKLVVSEELGDVTEKLSSGWGQFQRMNGVAVTVNPSQVRYVQDAPRATARLGEESEEGE